MDTVPIELEETPLKLEVVDATQSNCVNIESSADAANKATNIMLQLVPMDPLHKEDAEPDFEKMTELEKLIYSERQRLLPPKKYVPPKVIPRKKFSNIGLTLAEKNKIRMRKRRARETDEERDARKFRQRIVTMKQRLLQRLKNFDNEEYTEELKKQNTEKTRQRRKEQKLMETTEEKLERKSECSLKTRLAKLRRKIFKTPEEIVRERENKKAYIKKIMAKKTTEEIKAQQKLNREQAKERYRHRTRERRKFDLIVKGKPIEEIEAMEKAV